MRPHRIIATDVSCEVRGRIYEWAADLTPENKINPIPMQGLASIIIEHVLKAVNNALEPLGAPETPMTDEISRRGSPDKIKADLAMLDEVLRIFGVARSSPEQLVPKIQTLIDQVKKMDGGGSWANANAISILGDACREIELDPDQPLGQLVVMIRSLKQEHTSLVKMVREGSTISTDLERKNAMMSQEIMRLQGVNQGLARTNAKHNERLAEVEALAKAYKNEADVHAAERNKWQADHAALKKRIATAYNALIP